jgi:pyruvate formate lyase activating enzyme
MSTPSVLNTPSQLWRDTHEDARLWHPLEDGGVQCRLSPRGCRLREGQHGFCGVRRNVGGRLRTLNYGKSTRATQEFVETEALYHFAPGAPILSMGNVGCMMSCDYCHNWQTSQARHVRDADVHTYTPEQVVELCLERRIPIISWTYNDPVVWHEFVMDTSRLAHRHGLLTLYKSAFYISTEAARELTEVIDVFSLSLKSMDPAFYRRLTKGTLPPVLEATEVVARSGRHLEISNLLVTDANDGADDARKVADWVLEHGGPEMPLHYVRFHPDYKYQGVPRTPIDRLERAREIALARGLRYVYLGNVFDHPGTHTYCPGCGTRVVARLGMTTRVESLRPDGRCAACDRPLPFRALDVTFRDDAGVEDGPLLGDLSEQTHLWEGDVLSLHVEARNRGSLPARLRVERIGGATGAHTVPLPPDRGHRFVVSRASVEERGVRVSIEAGLDVHLLPLLDRAHFPAAG